jgi:hypothetical protein
LTEQLDPDLFPAEKPGIDRPGSWPNHRQAGPKCRQQNAKPGVSLMRDKQSQFSNCHYHSRQWSPQAEQKKKSGGSRDYLQYQGWHLACVRYPPDHAVEKKGSGYHSLEKEPCAGPTTSERRK